MIYKRKRYLDKLVSSRENGLVKIITGGRRCGKSFLLFHLFHDYLVGDGVSEDHIIELSLDDRRSSECRDPDKLLAYIDERVAEGSGKYYVILDEVQLVKDFVEVLLSLMHNSRLDVYVSGSNSRFLSKDVVTEFRGRGDEIRVWPLSFSEYCEGSDADRTTLWREYYVYGGLPQLSLMKGSDRKIEYLKNIYELTYFRDIVERNGLRNENGMEQLVEVLSSSIGSLTNPLRISNTFKSVAKMAISHNTIREYIGHLQDSYLIEGAQRYDVKGRKYIGGEQKYYFMDMGLRNAALNFRQLEENHIMENIIYNELRMRGFTVDVGAVSKWMKDDDKRKRNSLEVDFVANMGYKRYYIQSAFSMDSEAKREQEFASFRNLDDSFKKIVVVRDDIVPYYDENGFYTIGVFDFLMNEGIFDVKTKSVTNHTFCL